MKCCNNESSEVLNVHLAAVCRKKKTKNEYPRLRCSRSLQYTNNKLGYEVCNYLRCVV